MNLEEAARILAKAAAFDRRTVGEADIRAWHEALSDVPVDNALAAVTAHYREHTEWLMPAHIRSQAAQIARADRQAAELEAAQTYALEAGPTSDRSDDVIDLVAQLRKRIPEGSARKLRPRAHYWRRQQRANAATEPNSLYTGPPPPGGFPVPGDDGPTSLGAALVQSFEAGWPEDEQQKGIAL